MCLPGLRRGRFYWRRFAVGRDSRAPQVPCRSTARESRCGSDGGRGPDRVRRREHPTGRLVFTVVAFRVDELLLDEVADGTGEVALAVVELRRGLGNRVAAVDRSEDLNFDAPEYGIYSTKLVYKKFRIVLQTAGTEATRTTLTNKTY